ncbi:MAG: hypothetical protein ABEK50_13660 [bacterium]
MNSRNSSNPEEGGQALVELMAVIIILTFMAVGIYETGALIHNISVMNTGMETAATLAAHGAPFEVVRNQIYDEADNLLAGAFLEQRIVEDEQKGSNIYVEIWNPRTNEPLVTSYTPHQETFSPQINNVAPYMFWTEGYQVRIGVLYEIGIYVPFIRSFTLDFSIVGTRIIQVSNDVDRDGMVDSMEVEYLGWWLDNQGKTWSHPVHRDKSDTLDSNVDADIDGDNDMSFEADVCHLVITRVCDDIAANCSDRFVEIFNPTIYEHTLERVESANSGTWNLSTTMSPGEYFVIGTNASFDRHDNTFNPDDTLDGFRVESSGGQYCDAFGWDDDPLDSLSSQYFEGSPFSSISAALEAKRKKDSTNVPIDTDENTQDFADENQDLNPRSGYSKEDPKPYDFNNNGVQDKYEIDDSADTNENLLKGNHVIGPKNWPDTVP